MFVLEDSVLKNRKIKVKGLNQSALSPPYQPDQQQPTERITLADGQLPQLPREAHASPMRQGQGLYGS